MQPMDNAEFINHIFITYQIKDMEEELLALSKYATEKNISLDELFSESVFVNFARQNIDDLITALNEEYDAYMRNKNNRPKRTDYLV